MQTMTESASPCFALVGSPPNPALCSTRAGGAGLTVGPPFVPTPPEGRGAQAESKAPPLGGGSGATRSSPFASEHGEHPLFDAAEHRGMRRAAQRMAVVTNCQTVSHVAEHLSAVSPDCAPLAMTTG